MRKEIKRLERIKCSQRNVNKTKQVHQCLFCEQTFNSASDKDDQILEHFEQETCTECDQNLIRIGGYFYTRHNEITCIKNKNSAKQREEFCVASHIKMESDTLGTYELTPPINMSEMKSSTPVSVSDIRSRFPNINFNAIVVLDDIAKNTHTTEAPNSKRCKVQFEKGNLEIDIKAERIAQNSHERLDEYESTEQCEIENETESQPIEIQQSNLSTESMCEPLDEIFENNVGQSRTTHTQDDDKQYSDIAWPRQMCKLTFATDDQLKIHIPNYDRSRKETEKVLDSVTSKTLSLNESLDSLEILSNNPPTHNSEESILKCTYKACHRQFTNQQERILHLKTHETNDTFQPVLKLHYDLWHNVYKWQQNCNEKKKAQTEAQKTVQEQREISHNDADSQVVEYILPNDDEPMPESAIEEELLIGSHPNVDICQETSKQVHKDTFATAEQSQLMRFACDVCNYLFISEKEMEYHIFHYHKGIVQSQHKQGIGSSIQIDANSNGNKILQPLNKSQSNDPASRKEDVHRCSDCGDIFRFKFSLESHVLRYHLTTEERKFSCKKCRKKFPSKRNLSSHINVVHGPKTVKCEYCEKLFVNQSQLRQHHDIIHSTVEKYKCDTCGKTFKQTHYLTKHKLIHTGEKPFKCSYEHCTRTFRTTSDRLYHEQTHTNEKPYVCEIEGCAVATKTSGGLRKHRETQHGISTFIYSCKMCPDTFNKKMALLKHIQDMH